MHKRKYDNSGYISGYCINLGGNIVVQKSEKQSVVARSIAKAEYRAMTKASELI